MAHTCLRYALYGASMTFVALTRSSSVVTSAAADGLLIAWPMRPRRIGIDSGASGSCVHIQSVAKDDDDDDQVEGGYVKGGCDGAMLDVMEGALEVVFRLS